MKALLLSLPFFAATALSANIPFRPRNTMNNNNIWSAYNSPQTSCGACRSAPPSNAWTAPSEFVKVNHTSYTPTRGVRPTSEPTTIDLTPCNDNDARDSSRQSSYSMGNVAIAVDRYPLVANSDVTITYHVEFMKKVFNPTLRLEVYFFGQQLPLFELKLRDLLKAVTGDANACPLESGTYEGSITWRVPTIDSISAPVRISAVENNSSAVFCYDTVIDIVGPNSGPRPSSVACSPVIYRNRS